jgi:UDP-galactose transporter
MAAGNLSPTLFACLNQLKILSAALLSMVLLQKQIKLREWAALAILVVGATLVALTHVKPKKCSHCSDESDVLRGVVIILLASFLSSLAGVYLEKLLKGSTVTLAARNLQLSCYSAVIGYLVFFQSGGSPASFFRGFTTIVWVSIFNSAFCGFLIAVVLKYADNIWKNIAPTLSIVLTTWVEVVFLGKLPGPGELLGVALVITAVLLYSGVCSYARANWARSSSYARASARGYQAARRLSGHSASAPGAPAAQPPGPLPEGIGQSSVELGRPSQV